MSKDDARPTEEKTMDPFTGRKYFYAVGKRKSAIAQVRMYEKGSGKLVLNGKSLEEVYPKESEWTEMIFSPLKISSRKNDFDYSVKVVGGGQKGRAEAIRHAIARALVKFDESLKSDLRKAGFITRDARVKERKKYGLKGARRAPQFSKR